MAKPTTKPDRDANADAAKLPWWQQRRGVLAIGAALFAALIVLLAGHSWPLVLDHALTDLPLLLLWLAAAFGYGSLFNKLTPSPQYSGERAGERGENQSSANARSSANSPSPQPSPPCTGERELRLITHLALGLGILSTLQLLLGLAGMIHQLIAFAVIALGVALLAIRLRPQKIKTFLTAPAKSDYLWLITLPVLAIATVAAYVPPGILWGDEPNGYDVLEYHLQIPREWYDLGHIVPLHHNVFSYFPQGMEMHYLVAMQLRAGPWTGMYLAQLMHVAMIALTILAIYATARVFAPKIPATIAALTAAYIPWLTLLAPVAYNEGALLLFGTLAIGWTMRLVCTGDTCVAPIGEKMRATQVSPLQMRPAVIAGLLTGFACAVKLTAVPELLVLIPACFVLIALLHRIPVRQIVIAPTLFVLVALITFSPWLIRNTIWTHNPVFPEAQHLLGHAHFTDVQTQRWTLANHLPGPSQRWTMGRLTAAKDQIFADWRYAYLLLPLGFLAAAINFKNTAAKLLLALLLTWLIFWIGFTHVQSRFFALAIPVAALLLATLQSTRQQRPEDAASEVRRRGGSFWIFYTLAPFQILLGSIFIADLYIEKIAPLADKSILTFEDLSKFLPDDVQAALTDSDKPITLLGDAKAFLYQIPTARLHYRTVFDVDCKSNQSILDAWHEGAPADAIQIVDPSELTRFAKTYFGIPPLPENFPGPRDHTFVLPSQK